MKRLLFLLVVLALSASATAFAGVRLSGDEALALTWPNCKITRDTVFLTEKQRAQAAKLAGVKIRSAMVYRYRATCKGVPSGTAYFDKHRVRTRPERLMVALSDKGKVRRIEVLTFDEPTDYLPRAGWYAQFNGRGLGDAVRLDGAIRPIAGATLTARATVDAVRRVLAIDRVLREPATRSAQEETPP